MTTQKDNSTFAHKVALRARVMDEAGSSALVLETHGGFGRVFERVWHRAAGGVVFELDAAKARALALQRPRWDVYEADALRALRSGYGRWRPFHVVDLDPYGSCLEFLPLLFDAQRPRPSPWWLTINCGLRQALGLGQGWKQHLLTPYFSRFGNHELHARYLEVLQLFTGDLAAAAGERVAAFSGYYCGAAHAMTHAALRVERVTPPPVESGPGTDGKPRRAPRGRRADA